MRIVFFRHPSITVAEASGNNLQRDTFKRQQGRIGVPENMEADAGFDFGCRASVMNWAALVARTPGLAVSSDKHVLFVVPTSGNFIKEILAFLSQGNMARLAGLAVSNVDGAGVLVVVPDPEGATNSP